MFSLKSQHSVSTIDLKNVLAIFHSLFLDRIVNGRISLHQKKYVEWNIAQNLLVAYY